MFNSLHTAAYGIVRPIFDEDRMRAIDRLASLLGSGDAHATLDAGAIVKAAPFRADRDADVG
jgi:hypothetical protein